MLVDMKLLCVKPMAGDAAVVDPTYSATLAITVGARPEHIWTWLVQMGYQRGGLYSFDWLDRLFGYLVRPIGYRFTDRPDRRAILLSDLVEARLPEVFWSHERMKGHARVEVQEEWFGNGREPRRVGDIDDEGPTALPVMVFGGNHSYKNDDSPTRAVGAVAPQPPIPYVEIRRDLVNEIAKAEMPSGLSKAPRVSRT